MDFNCLNEEETAHLASGRLDYWLYNLCNEGRSFEPSLLFNARDSLRGGELFKQFFDDTDGGYPKSEGLFRFDYRYDSRYPSDILSAFGPEGHGVVACRTGDLAFALFGWLVNRCYTPLPQRSNGPIPIAPFSYYRREVKADWEEFRDTDLLNHLLLDLAKPRHVRSFEGAIVLLAILYKEESDQIMSMIDGMRTYSSGCVIFDRVMNDEYDLNSIEDLTTTELDRAVFFREAAHQEAWIYQNGVFDGGKQFFGLVNSLDRGQESEIALVSLQEVSRAIEILEVLGEVYLEQRPLIDALQRKLV